MRVPDGESGGRSHAPRDLLESSLTNYHKRLRELKTYTRFIMGENTVKPALSGTLFKRATFIEQSLDEVP